MKIWKYSGTLLTATGILHTVIALIMGYEAFVEIYRNGIFNAVEGDCAREHSFWFLVCGIIIILFGNTLQYYIRKTRTPAPLSLGWVLLVISITGCVFEPVSGFWLFIPQAVIIIAANKKR